MSFFFENRSGDVATLTNIILVAASEEAYSFACKTPGHLRQCLEDGRILCQGEIIKLDSLAYTLWSLEPVPKGRARSDHTEIVLLPSLSVLPGDIISHENDSIEINEGFLAGSETSEPAAFLFTVKSLDTPQDDLEDLFSLYVRTSDLGKTGILSHDWAIVYTKISQSRLVRVIASDDLVTSLSSVAGPPILLQNIIGSDTFCENPSLYISPSPFGASLPAIPVARSITVARIASPFSISKRYQALSVKALKLYFESRKRLMKPSDLFACPIDTDDCHLSTELNGTEATLIELGHPTRSPRFNEVLFFKITNISYDVVPLSENFHPHLYRSSTLGELGCWVDSTTTIVQAGVEHSRIPNAQSYLQLDTRLPPFVNDSLQSIPSSIDSEKVSQRLLSLISAALSQRAVDYDLSLTFLLNGHRGVGKFSTVTWVALQLGFHIKEIDCYELLDESNVNTEATLQVYLDQAVNSTPCILVLRHLEALSRTTQSQDINENFSTIAILKEELAKAKSNWRMTGYPLVVVGTTSEKEDLSSGVLDCFKHIIDFQAPTEQTRVEILKSLVSKFNLASDVSLRHIATQTAAFVAADLYDLVCRAQAACMTRVGFELDPYLNTALTSADFSAALGGARESLSETIGAPKIPAVSWDDVGGLAHVKTDILDMIQLPLEHPELFVDGLKRRSGILLYGPPGTGKTLIAKAVATSFSLNFFSVKGPELLNMYIGESEANVRKVFQRARDAKPCVIFFDELDSVAPKRGNQGDSGGVMDRIVSQLLAELDGISAGKDGTDVFVIGATNRPDLLDPALLRPGRFDRMLYLGVSETHEAQLNILEALTRKFRLDPEFDLPSLAEKCPFNFTGADFYALCSDAMLSAMSRTAEAVDEKIAILNAQPPPYRNPHPITPQYYLAELALPDEIQVSVSTRDFEQALKSLVPSVSQAAMEHYAQVQKHFSDQSFGSTK